MLWRLDLETRRAWPGRQTLLSLFHVTFLISIGKLRFRKTVRPCSDPGVPGPAARALARETRGLPAGRGGARAEGLRQRPEHACGCQPCARSAAPWLRAKGGREGATDSRAWRSSPFFAADPGKGGRPGGGTAKGGIPSLVRAEDWPFSGLGATAERRRDGEHERRAESEERTAERGTGESEGRPEPPQRTDVPGGALAPEGVSRWQIEQLGNQRAERGRAQRPGQSCGGRVSGRSLARPGSAPAAAGRAEVGFWRCPC